ncbi:MAG: UbiA family prenyltransferase [Planctomycetota bacterium]|nr:UbiA family prenyltransferase [Planctomycetota bacterium]
MADLLRLIRAPMVFSTTGDVLVGYFCIDPPKEIRIVPLLLVCLASACLYSFGMATNDIFDRGRDRKLHPQRPLPSGRVSLRFAWRLAVWLPVFAFVASMGIGSQGMATTGGIVLLILAYNAWLKRFDLAGSVVMGMIRGANVLLGWSALGTGIILSTDALSGPATYVFIYIACITWISTAEEVKRPRGSGHHPRVAIAMLILFALMARLSFQGPLSGTHPYPDRLLDPLYLLFSIVLWRLVASRDSSKHSTFQTVRTLLLGLFFLDAHLLYATGQVYLALIPITLVIPSMILSRRLRISS